MPVISTEEVRTAGNDACIAPMETGPSSRWESILNQMQITIDNTLEHRAKSALKQTLLMDLTKQLKMATISLESNARNLDIGIETRNIIMGMIEQFVAEYDGAIKAYREEFSNVTVRCGVLEAAFQSVATTLRRESPEPTLMTQRQQDASSQYNEALLKQVQDENSKLKLEKKYLNIELRKVIKENSEYKSRILTLSKDERSELNELRTEVRNHDTSIRNLEEKLEAMKAPGKGRPRKNVTESSAATGASVTLNPTKQPDKQLQIIQKYHKEAEHQMNEFTASMKKSLGSIENGYEKKFTALNETVKVLFKKASEGSEILTAKRSSEIVEREIGRISSLPVELSKRPKTLMDMWLEYTTGLGGRKPAKHFTQQDRGKVKFKYCRRKVFWDCVSLHIRGGYTAATAIDRIQSVYGMELPVSTILRRMAQDRKIGGNPNLKV